MYVIYINDRPLTLCAKTEHRTGARAASGLVADTHLTAVYSGKPRTLLHYADMLEKGSPKVLSVDIVTDDLEQLWADFRGHYRWLPAAGGLVRNSELDRYLFIFRRGYWDLPKGKIEDGENELTAALREVEEETGVSKLVPGKALPTTYHTYRNRKEKRVLKPTYWFGMETNQVELVPQAEEDIEKAVWRKLEELLVPEANIYQNLLWLLHQLPAE